MRRGRSAGGRAGQRGAARAATGEGARREGAEDGPPEGGAGRGGEGAGEGRRRGGSPRGGDGEESGQQGPVGAGVLTSLRGRRPLPVRVAPSEAPAALRRPRLPSALPRRPGPAPPARSLRGPPATPCASAGLQKVGAPYPTAALISGPGQLCPLRGRERDRNRAGGQDSLREGQRGRDQNGGGTGVEPEQKGERCVEDGFASRLLFPPRRDKRGGQGVGPKSPGWQALSHAQHDGWTLAPCLWEDGS